MSLIDNVVALINGQTRYAWHVNAKDMLYWINKSGGDLVSGDVVVQDTSYDKAFKSTTTVGDLTVVGVIPQIDDVDGNAGTQTIAHNGYGWIQTEGDIATVTVDGATNVGDYLIASGTAKKATPVGYPARGAFAIATTLSLGAGTVKARLIPILLIAPSGSLVAYGGASAPTGYLLCDGASVLRATYPTLFTAIGTTYGSVDGTHFNVPDLKGRVPVGKGAHADVNALADSDGLADADRTPNHAAHTHTVPRDGWGNEGATTTTDRVMTSDASVQHALNGVTSGAGSDNPSGFLTVNYIIKC